MKRLLASVLLAGGTLLTPVAALGQKDTPASTADDRISDLVRMRLAGDADVKGGALDVTVKDGEVTLKGRVDTEKGKEKASKLSKKVKGVTGVINQLLVGPPE